jgi:hypothetical protein
MPLTKNKNINEAKKYFSRINKKIEQAMLSTTNKPPSHNGGSSGNKKYVTIPNIKATINKSPACSSFLTKD